MNYIIFYFDHGCEDYYIARQCSDERGALLKLADYLLNSDSGVSLRYEMLEKSSEGSTISQAVEMLSVVCSSCVIKDMYEIGNKVL